MRQAQRDAAEAAGGPAAAATDASMSIGAVCEVLRADFPGLSVAWIRFLEAERLVVPERTPGGGRKFRPTDVERLVGVLRMRRDHFLPLASIRDYFEALDRGERPALPSAGTSLQAAASHPGEAAPAGSRGVRVDRRSLLDCLGVSAECLAEWEEYGILATDEDCGATYGAEEVTVARLAAELARYGLQPRHLRSVKNAAERETDLVRQITAPLRRNGNERTRERAEELAERLGGLSVRLYAAFVWSELAATRGVGRYTDAHTERVPDYPNGPGSA